MGEVIFITSGKGGVGKTTVTANLGKELARSDKKVMLLDFDFGLRNLDIILGLEQAVVYDISDVLEGRCRLRQAVIHPWRDLPMYFLPAAADADYLPDSERFSYLMENLKASFDYILIDSPAGVSQLFGHDGSLFDFRDCGGYFRFRIHQRRVLYFPNTSRATADRPIPDLKPVPRRKVAAPPEAGRGGSASVLSRSGARHRL